MAGAVGSRREKACGCGRASVGVVAGVQHVHVRDETGLESANVVTETRRREIWVTGLHRRDVGGDGGWRRLERGDEGDGEAHRGRW